MRYGKRYKQQEDRKRRARREGVKGSLTTSCQLAAMLPTARHEPQGDGERKRERGRKKNPADVNVKEINDRGIGWRE